MIRAIARWFRLRAVASEMGLLPRLWWGNARLLQALFDERCRREIARVRIRRSIFELPKNVRRLDFRPSESKAKTPASGGQ